MKYLFLNPQSCSGQAMKKWNKIKNHLGPSHELKIVDQFYAFDWDQLEINKGDTFISGGGDGTLHCLVNALIKKKGLDSLSSITIGHIGLGSNNSFLRPYSECQILNGIPMRISDSPYVQDLLEIEVINKGQSQIVYCVSNASLGFLATANILFNTSSDIAFFKKWNSDLADIYTFLKALIKWKPISLGLEFENRREHKMITNMHFMKKPYYATDLGFPETIPPTNGKFRLNILWKKNPIIVLKKFCSMLILKNLLEGRDETSEIEKVHVTSDHLIPIEMDGEIYYGEKFTIKIYKKGIQLCK